MNNSENTHEIKNKEKLVHNLTNLIVSELVTNETRHVTTIRSNCSENTETTDKYTLKTAVSIEANQNTSIYKGAYTS